MVATRRSLPNAVSDDEDEDELAPQKPDDTVRGVEVEPDMENKRVRNALRKLQIDGTAALAGNRVNRRQTTGTYHYRGAVYDITDDTPQTWIDQQPVRYRRSESETRPMLRRRGARKRTLADVKDESIQGDDDDDEARPAKRTRRSMPGPATRTRRQSHLVELSAYHTRSAAVGDTVTDDRERQLHQRRQHNARIAMDPRADVTERIAAAREVARDKGYEVEPLTDSDFLNAEQRLRRMLSTTLLQLGRVNTRIEKLSKEYQGMRARGEFDHLLASACTAASTDEDASGGAEGNKGQEQATEERGDSEETDEEEPKLEMPKPADIALHAYGSPSSGSQQLHDRELSSSPGAQSDNTNKSLRITSFPAEKDIEHRSDSPIRKDSDIALSIEPVHEPDAHPSTLDDELAAPQRPHAPDEAVDEQIHHELTRSVDGIHSSHRPSLDISDVDAGDHAAAPTDPKSPPPAPPSLPTDPSSEDKSDPAPPRRWTPKLSDRLGDEERAENAIYQDRRRSETPQAWRRRVQREIALVRSWPLADTSSHLTGLGAGELVAAESEG